MARERLNSKTVAEFFTAINTFPLLAVIDLTSDLLLGIITMFPIKYILFVHLFKFLLHS